ncbi:hypothetical protein [Roseobacter sp.]|uniref:hypothetical protein n=1 Tax=Roseobacter sp. TaxID=1907202 RepID=UPI0032998553
MSAFDRAKRLFAELDMISAETTHAGGVPQQNRRDAILAGAELVATLESWWLQTENSGGVMVLTMGEFSTDPTQHATTKVPRHLGFTMDMRSQDSAILNQFDHLLKAIVAKITAERGVSIDLGPATRTAPAPMAPAFQTGLIQAARHCGIDQTSLPSGGGHDCATFAGISDNLRAPFPSACLWACFLSSIRTGAITQMSTWSVKTFAVPQKP